MNSLDPTLMATTSQDGVFIYDLRNVAKRLFTFQHHLREVTQCKWSPHNTNVFATCSKDRRVAILDLSLIETPRFTDDFHNTDQAVQVE